MNRRDEKNKATRRRSRRKAAALKTISVLPTLFTLGNLLCGFAAIFMASRSADPDIAPLPQGWTAITYAALFVFLGMVLDGLDGRIARLTRSTSELGEQLDSMADMVTFGVAPAFIAVQLIRVQTPFVGSEDADAMFGRIALVISCIYVACAALRLARFNIETNSDELKDHLYFSGLPSPGAAGTIVALALWREHYLYNLSSDDWQTQLVSISITIITLLTAFAMVSRLRYPHVLNLYVRQRAPFETVVIIVVLGLLLVVKFQASLSIGLIAYALSAPTLAIWRKLTRKNPTPKTPETVEE